MYFSRIASGGPDVYYSGTNYVTKLFPTLADLARYQILWRSSPREIGELKISAVALPADLEFIDLTDRDTAASFRHLQLSPYERKGPEVAFTAAAQGDLAGIARRCSGLASSWIEFEAFALKVPLELSNTRETLAVSPHSFEILREIRNSAGFSATTSSLVIN